MFVANLSLITKIYSLRTPVLLKEVCHFSIYEKICLEKYFYKSIHISLFNKYFCRNKKVKLCFGDRVATQNDFLYEYRGSTILIG